MRHRSFINLLASVFIPLGGCSSGTISHLSEASLDEAHAQETLSFLQQNLSDVSFNASYTTFLAKHLVDQPAAVSAEMAKAPDALRVAMKQYTELFPTHAAYFHAHPVKPESITLRDIRNADAAGRNLSNRTKGLALEPLTLDEHDQARALYVSLVFQMMQPSTRTSTLYLSPYQDLSGNTYTPPVPNPLAIRLANGATEMQIFIGSNGVTQVRHTNGIDEQFSTAQWQPNSVRRVVSKDGKLKGSLENLNTTTGRTVKASITNTETGQRVTSETVTVSP